MKQSKGITLVALVITIILMLILAGISIQAMTGTGIFESAKRAELENKRAQVSEYLNLKLLTQQMLNSTGSAEKIIKATREDVNKNISELKEIGKEVTVEETSTEEDGEEVEIYFYVIVDKDVYKVSLKGVEFIGEQGKFPPIIKIESATSTTNSITVKVKTWRNQGGKIKYYIKAENEEKYTEKETTTEETYTYTELEQNKTYSIKIEVIAENKQTAEVTKEIKVGTMPPVSEISMEGVTWIGTKATVKFATTTKFIIQTTITPTIEETWKTSNEITVETGTTVYARLTDGYNKSSNYMTAIPELQYKITLNSNDGKGNTEEISCKYGKNYTLTKNKYTRDGFTFKGWSTSPSGTVEYTDQQNVINLSTENGKNINLYAVWEEIISASIKTNNQELTAGTQFTYSAENIGAGIKTGTISINGITILTITNKNSVSGTITIEEFKDKIKNLEFLNTYTVSIAVTGGTGKTANSSLTITNYTVSNEKDVKKLATQVNSGNNMSGKTIYQICDINLNGSSTNQWTPIGNMTNPFAGTYDGGYNKIENIYINNTNSCQGYFGNNSGTIKKLVINSGTLKVGGFSGSLVGHNTGTIEQAGNNVDLYAYMSESDSGGLVGYSRGEKAVISQSYNSGNISGNIVLQYGDLGGIAGTSNGGSTVQYCYNTGNVTATSEEQNVRVSGICDGNELDIISCYNIGKITLTAEKSFPVAAGIVGQLHEGTMSNSFNVGKTTINTSLTYEIRNAGLSGYRGEKFTNCYWLKSASTVGVCYSDDSEPYESDEIIGKDSEAEIKKNALNILGTEYFEADSKNQNNGYPILKWQNNVKY